MFGKQSMATAYAKAGLEARVEVASPHELITMLFDGAIDACVRAKGHMQRKEIADKGALISKAIGIVTQGLQASLDLKNGEDLAKNLNALYEYITFRLLEANLHNDMVILDEVTKLLSELREAWAAIKP